MFRNAELEYGMILPLVSTPLIAALILLKAGVDGYYDGLVDALGGIL